MSKEKILVVDDELEIRELIIKYISREGMIPFESSCGLDALEKIKCTDYDLIILDIMLEDMSGFDVLQEIREFNPMLPILFLSARQEDSDKVLGLGLGADDYITKPFSPSELIARVKSHLRRMSLINTLKKDEPLSISCGNLIMDLKSYTVTKKGEELSLSATEIKLFKFFMENQGRVFTKAQIYRNVWNDDFFDDNSVMVYISHLRDKIEDNSKEPKYVQTIRGLGYKFQEPKELM